MSSPRPVASPAMHGSVRVFDCDAVLFDCDGVLVDSIAGIEHVWRLWAEEHELAPDRVLADIHGHRTVDIIRRHAPWLHPDREARRHEAMEIGHADQVAALPGAAEILAGLAVGTWAVVTSGTRALARARLSAAGLPVPDVVVGADSVARGKPEPDGYELAAARLGVEPRRCSVIEDAPAGIVAARRARIPVVALTTTHPEEDLDSDAHAAGLHVLGVHDAPTTRYRLTVPRA